ncbi:fimbrial protein [Vibrio cincinnatiensis]|uniref:hypothetical protein n=1 Tax=Vibrio cincinnatiensis TaxID=675 RepID=UPI0012AC85E3|nr:hypothetical protein [Vibrio cincinnatiensis]
MELSQIAKGVIFGYLLVSTPIYAAQSGWITFVGSINVTTCEKNITFNNKYSLINQILLDEVTPSRENWVRFSIATVGNEGKECRAESISETYLTSPAMSARGLENMSGMATDTYLNLIPTPRKNNKNNKLFYVFEDGADFYGIVQNGNSKGIFNTIATINVVYY